MGTDRRTKGEMTGGWGYLDRNGGRQKQRVEGRRDRGMCEIDGGGKK